MSEKRVVLKYSTVLLAGLVFFAILLPLGGTLAQSSEELSLVTLEPVRSAGTSAGGAYVLEQIDVWPLTRKSQGKGYALVPFGPEQVLADSCTYLPILSRGW